MTKILFSPGLGNQFFQAVAAIRCKKADQDLGQVVVSNRYLSNKHGGQLLTELPFIRGLTSIPARWIDDVVYFAWQRLGNHAIVHFIMDLMGCWVEPPLPWCHSSVKVNDDIVGASHLGAGYFQDVVAASIKQSLDELIDVPSLDALLSKHDIRAARCIHIRAGDYQAAGIYSMLDASYYLSCVSSIAPSCGVDDSWEVVTDNPDDPRVQSIYEALQKYGIRLEPMSRFSVMHDLLRLINAQSLVCANSTFSIAAAYIRSLRDGEAIPPCVPRAWFNTPALKAPGFYDLNWNIH